MYCSKGAITRCYILCLLSTSVLHRFCPTFLLFGAPLCLVVGAKKYFFGALYKNSVLLHRKSQNWYCFILHSTSVPVWSFQIVVGFCVSGLVVNTDRFCSLWKDQQGFWLPVEGPARTMIDAPKEQKRSFLLPDAAFTTTVDEQRATTQRLRATTQRLRATTSVSPRFRRSVYE